MTRPRLNVAFLGGEVVGRGSLTMGLTQAIEMRLRRPLEGRWQRPVPYHFAFDTPERSCVGIDYGHFTAPAVHLPGSSTVIDAAVLVVSAVVGVRPQTRAHGLLARECGVRRVLLFIDTTRTTEGPADVAEADTRTVLAALGYPADDLPAVRGNVVRALRSEGQGDECRFLDELLETLDTTIPNPYRDEAGSFLLSVDDLPGPRSAAGWVLRGRVRVGEEVDTVGVEPLLGTPILWAMDRSESAVEEAKAGDRVTVYLGTPFSPRRGLALEVGQVLAAPGSARTSARFEAECFVPTRAEGGSDEFLVPGILTLFRIRGRETVGTFLLSPKHPVAMPGDRVRVEVELNGDVVVEPGLRFTVIGPAAELDLGDDLPEAFGIVLRVFG